jgi:Zn-dependent M28 family amino/carboxypeptidase
MPKIVYLILIALCVSLSYSTTATGTHVRENSLDNTRGIFPTSIYFNAKLESESEETPKKFTYWVENQVNSTNLKDSVDNLSSFHTRHTKSAYIEDVMYWLKNKFEKVCEDRVYFNNFTQIDNDSSYNLKNIICTQEGSAINDNNNNNILLILAHYDSRMEDINQANARAPGADDNASGVAAVLELARILSQINLENDIQFVLLSGEEQGQWGSRAYLEHLRATDTRPDLVMNLDMIGHDALKQSKVLIEYDQGSKSKINDIHSKRVADLIKEVASEYTNLNASLSKLGKTDLLPFEAAGNTVIGLHDGGTIDNPNYHRMSDTLSTLDTEYLTSITKLALATILELGSRDWQ